MLELLFLLLPVAVAYGWYMGRRSLQQDKQHEANRLSRDYVAGVNFLLSDQQDQAVELFLDMLKKEDNNAFEAHLTLGNLFRSRGEVDRAIRIHQALTESASLTFEQRLLAVQQLGRDYMAAGLYDRAESMFNQLLDEQDFRLLALQQLLLIYQATSDWLKAIEVAEKLVKQGESERSQLIAHFYCELALQTMGNDDLEKALTFLKKAAQIEEHCARVSIMLGRVYLAREEYVLAIDAMEQVLQQDKEVIGEVLPMLQKCHQLLNGTSVNQVPRWERFLRRCVEENSGADAELLLAELLEQQQGREVAQNYLQYCLQRNPTMRVFYRLMLYQLVDAEQGRAKESLLLLRDMVGQQIRSKPRYRCHKCGFTANSLYWQCPSCRSWEVVKPIRGLDGV